MAPKSFFVCKLLIFSLSFLLISSIGIKFEVINEAATHPGGIKFTKEIGIPYTKELMSRITNFIWSTFQQNNPADRKLFDVVEVFIKDFKGVSGITQGNRINVSAFHVQNYTGDVKWLFAGLMYHEGTHVFQWNGEGKSPAMLVEGIAEFVKIKANYILPDYFKPGDGDKWDQGYGFTARFLEYCDGIFPGFVANLNKKMRKTYDISYFRELTGKPVEQLWKEYKAKYAKKN